MKEEELHKKINDFFKSIGINYPVKIKFNPMLQIVPVPGQNPDYREYIGHRIDIEFDIKLDIK